MTRDTFLYGCRSGIQKAVRRGDLGIAKTCFDALWSEKEHRNWLKWRTPVLVVEEGVHLAGEYSKMYSGLKSIAKDSRQERDEWRKFIYRLTVSRKGKDAGGLSLLAETLMGMGKSSHENKEINIAMVVRRKMATQKHNDVADDIYNRVLEGEFGSLDDYEKSGVRVYLARAKSGGMTCDKIQCVIAMTMIAMRGMKENEIHSNLRVDIEAAKSKNGSNILSVVDLPWYCYDMHTRPGKMAMGIFTKKYGAKYGLQENTFDEVWFFMESGWSPRSVVLFPKDRDKPKLWESRWWDIIAQRRGSFGGKGFKETRELWVKEIRKEIKGLVEWAKERA